MRQAALLRVAGAGLTTGRDFWWENSDVAGAQAGRLMAMEEGAVVLRVPLEARTQYLVRAYDDILSDSETLAHKLSFLRAHRGGEVVDGWNAMIDAGDKAGVTRALMAQHYDPSYLKSRKAIGVEPAEVLDLPDLSEPVLADSAARICEMLERMG